MSNCPTFCAACLLFCTALPALVDAAELRVVTTIRPVHSLVAAVMVQGQPSLLYSGTESPHETALRPSQARALQAADLIVRVDAGFETALRRPLRTMASGATILTLSQAAGVTRLPRRGEGGTGTDPHIWLDPRNAAAMVRAIPDALAALDPQRANALRARAEQAAVEFSRLDSEIAALLAGRPPTFVAGHDAFQYFEARYGLQAVGALIGPDGSRLGVRGSRELRRRALAAKAGCVLDDGPIPGRLARTLAADLGARLVSFDVLGSNLEPGPGLYPALLRQGTKILAACLGKP